MVAVDRRGGDKLKRSQEKVIRQDIYLWFTKNMILNRKILCQRLVDVWIVLFFFCNFLLLDFFFSYQSVLVTQEFFLRTWKSFLKKKSNFTNRISLSKCSNN